MDFIVILIGKFPKSKLILVQMFEIFGFGIGALIVFFQSFFKLQCQ